jgi:transposase
MKILTKVFGKERYAKVMICLVLLAFGVSKSDINKKMKISYPALRKYKRAIDEGKTEGLFEFKGSRSKSMLDDYEELILSDFDKKPPKTLREAQLRIEKLTGIKRSVNRIRVWLKKKGFAVCQ